MPKRSQFALAAVWLAFFAAPAAGEGWASAISECAAVPDDMRRLACYDKIAAQMKTADAPQRAAADFGSESLPPPPTAAGPLDELTAELADVSFNVYGRFIVTLDNGQIWRQLESDTGKAHFRGKAKIRISRGLLGSYNLVIEGSNALFKVKRIR